VNRSGVPFGERGGVLRGCLDLISGRFPPFVFGGRLGDGLLPVFHFHDVTAEELDPKLRYLAENEYRTATADDIAAHVRGAPRPVGPRVALCFDDAWTSLWTVAAPLLKRYGLSAITYAIPARMADAVRCRPTIDEDAAAGASPQGPRFVTWPELRALHSSGVVDVQCHTDTHSMIFCGEAIAGFVTPEYATTPFLNRPQIAPLPALRFVDAGELGAPLYAARSRMSDGRRVKVSIELHARCIEHVARAGGAAFFSRPGWRAELTRLARDVDHGGRDGFETDVEQARAIEDELASSRAVLNERLGTRTVNHICLPWGVSGRRTAAALVRLDYRSAFANRLRGLHAVRPGDDPYWLKRLPNKFIFRLPRCRRRTWA
jgi:hypothetical protein